MKTLWFSLSFVVLASYCSADKFVFDGQTYEDAQSALSAQREKHLEIVGHIAPLDAVLTDRILIIAPTQRTVLEYGVSTPVRRPSERLLRTLDYLASLTMVEHGQFASYLEQRQIASRIDFVRADDHSDVDKKVYDYVMSISYLPATRTSPPLQDTTLTSARTGEVSHVWFGLRPDSPSYQEVMNGLSLVESVIRRDANRITKRDEEGVSRETRATSARVVHSGSSEPKVAYHNQFVNGREFVVGTLGEVQVWTHLMIGGDLQALIYIVNGTDRSITFDPSQVAVQAVKYGNNKSDRVVLRTFGATEYEKKVRRRDAWIGGLNALSAGLSNLQSPQTSSFSGNYSSSGSFGYSSGTYYGQITTWPSSADYAAANARTLAQIQSVQAQLDQSFSAMSAQLLRKHTLTPKTYVGGIVHIKKKKADLYDITVPFDGNRFRVTFNRK